MKVSIVFFAASITVALAGCPTKKIYNQPNCLPKSEYDPYWQRTLTFTSANGPCFKGSKEPVSLGKLMLYKKLLTLFVLLGHRCALSTRVGYRFPVNVLTLPVAALLPLPHSAPELRYFPN